MSNPLPNLYRDRARSTPSAFDLDEVMRDVHARVERRSRRRRTGFAAGGSAAVVAALAVVTVASTTSGSGGGDERQAAAGPGSHSASFSFSSSAAPSSDSQPKDVPVPVRTGGRLVTIETPKSAPLALGKVPNRFVYLGRNITATVYGSSDAKDKNPEAYLGKIALLVGTRYKHPAFTDKIVGLPARIRAITPSTGDPTRWMVDIDYNAKILLTIQVPNSAGLTRAQVRKMAQTLDIRDVSHPAAG